MFFRMWRTLGDYAPWCCPRQTEARIVYIMLAGPLAARLSVHMQPLAMFFGLGTYIHTYIS